MKNLSTFMFESLANADELLTESEVKDKKSFTEYAKNKLKKIHGDDYDEDKADKTIDGILNDNKELVDDNDWGALIGILNKGVVK